MMTGLTKEIHFCATVDEAIFTPYRIGFCSVSQVAPIHQVIPGNLQKYVSTNCSLLQCKTLPAHFSNNMMVII